MILRFHCYANLIVYHAMWTEQSNMNENPWNGKSIASLYHIHCKFVWNIHQQHTCPNVSSLSNTYHDGLVHCSLKCPIHVAILRAPFVWCDSLEFYWTLADSPGYWIKCVAWKHLSKLKCSAVILTFKISRWRCNVWIIYESEVNGMSAILLLISLSCKIDIFINRSYKVDN